MTDRIPETEPPPLQEAPMNLAALAAGAFVDGVHIRLKINWDITRMSEDRQKLLLHLITGALKEFEKAVTDMGTIEVASKLGRYERVKAAMKQNSQPSNG